MPSISISEKVHYFYEDSGAPESTSYTTLLCVHGLGYNGGIFRRLALTAKHQNYRVLAVYRRGYLPTTDLNEADSKDMSDFERQEKIIKSQGVELAIFISKVALKCNLPINSGATGGVAVIAWSLACITVLSMLACIDVVPKQETEILTGYLRTIILHDPITSYLGLDLPEGLFQAKWTSAGPENSYSLFNEFITGYYQHGEYRVGNDFLIEHVNPTNHPHSLSSYSLEEVHEIGDEQAFQKEFTVPFGALQYGRELARRAIFNQALAENYLPNLRVRFLYSRNSPGVIVWSALHIQWLLLDSETHFGGPNARNISVHGINNANHFSICDVPEQTLKVYERYI